MSTFKLPDLGEGLADAEIIRWHVKSGDHVNVDDPMLAVETAKAVVEVPSPFCGVIKVTHGKPGDLVATGALLVEFEPDRATDTDITLTRAAGTGVGRMPVGGADFFDEPVVGSDNAAALQSGRLRATISTGAEQLRGPRRAMAQTMAFARDTVMGCSLFDDADLHEWRGDQDITSRLLRAISAGCAAEPGMNAWFDGDAQVRELLSHINVAMAVDTPEGLLVPVIRNIGGRTPAQLQGEVARLKRGALDRTLRQEELRGFTFMLTNFGTIAGRYATPAVVPPAVAILGSGRLSHDVIATEAGTIEVHRRIPLSLTFDHRCVTGGEAARFLAATIQDLQKGD